MINPKKVPDTHHYSYGILLSHRHSRSHSWGNHRNGHIGLGVAKGIETAKEEESDTARCDMLGLLYEVPGSRPEDQDELSCESCSEKKAEIFQVTGNYCLCCWQQVTHPDL